MSDTPTIQPDSFLTLHYRLSDDTGLTIVDTFEGLPATLSLGAGELAPAIEAQLVGKREGDTLDLTLPPGAAFGERNDGMIQRVSQQLLDTLGDAPTHYAVGDAVSFPAPDGSGVFGGVVREIGDGWTLFDFNHPLAGRGVRFEARILGVL